MSTLRRSASVSLIPVLRRENSASSIPVLKRESSSVTKRESRPVRQSRTSDARKKQSIQKRYSKSTDRFSNKLTTPLRNRSSSRSPIGSVSVKKSDKRPINDKDWQKQQLEKVQNFLFTQFQMAEVNRIQPGLSIDLFVGVVQSLLKVLDDRIIVTKDNYVEQVPQRLKCFKYPAPVKPSLMKTVNVPHSWPQVIAILSWLVDLIQRLEYMKTTLILPINVNKKDAENFMAIIDFNNKSIALKQSNEDETELFKEYESAVCKIYQVNPGNVKKYKTEIEILEERLVEMRQQEESISKTNQEYKQKIAKIEDSLQSHIALKNKAAEDLKKAQEQLKYKRKITDEKLLKWKKSIQNLKERIASQPYSASYKKMLDQKLADLKFTKNLKEERLNELKELSDTYDLQLAENRRKVKTTVNKVNNIIKDARCNNLDIGMNTLRETRFTDPQFLEEIAESKMQYEKKNSIVLKAIKESQEHLQNQLDIKNQIFKEHDDLAKEIRQLEDECNEAEGKLYEKQCLKEMEIKKLKKDVEEGTKDLEKIAEDHRMQKEKNKALQKRLEEDIKRKECAQEGLEKAQKASLEVLENAVHSVTEYRRTLLQLLVDLEKDIIKADAGIEERIENAYKLLEKMDQLQEMYEKTYSELFSHNDSK